MSTDHPVAEGCAPGKAKRGPRSQEAPPRAELSALSDPIRWTVLELLSGGERCVCDLEGATGLAQSRLSYHVGVLRDAGLVSGRREGRWSYYSLNPAALERVSDRLRELASQRSIAAQSIPTSVCSPTEPGE